MLAGSAWTGGSPTGELEREVAAWEAERNEPAIGVDWRFTTADARIKLQHLYPLVLFPLLSLSYPPG